MLHSVASDLGLHCSPMPHKKDARLIWFKLEKHNSYGQLTHKTNTNIFIKGDCFDNQEDNMHRAAM